MSKESQKEYYTKQRKQAEEAADEGDARARATVSKINKKLGKSERSYTDPDSVTNAGLGLVGPGGAVKGAARAGIKAAAKFFGEDALGAASKRVESQLAKKSFLGVARNKQTPSKVEQMTRTKQSGGSPGASQHQADLTRSGAAARSLDARAVGDRANTTSKNMLKTIFQDG
jgi:hypothetical protein